ncbi:8694_t:CDS:2 [Diversispora eburnea]|uniref:8694_t:CDS:1 n=1 Tax=Diversispora eburnea TaxID=1213867 RepID=A0A9N8YVD2_9GLOM|nr:8694_t:CDS:2 [Diversispora eburnea]
MKLYVTNAAKIQTVLQELHIINIKNSFVSGLKSLSIQKKLLGATTGNASNSNTFLRELITKVHASPQRCEKLSYFCKFHEVNNLKPILDVAAQWNSTFEMISIALKMRTEILIKKAAEKSKEKLLEYYNKTNETYLIATILDPRFKILYYYYEENE